MALRPLSRLRGASTSIVRGRAFARTAVDSTTDVLHPLITISRGLRTIGAAIRRRWTETPHERRGPALLLGAVCVLVVALLPYGPLLAVAGLLAAAAWAGRRPAPDDTGPSEAGAERLGTIYEALVPYFSASEDPSALYSHGGDWSGAFDEYTFDEHDRLTRLHLRYPAYFTDGEPEARARIEQLLHTKSGRGREYLFEWDEEANRLTLTVLPALSTAICAQRFVTTPRETVLGFTDTSSVQRTLPVTRTPESSAATSASDPDRDAITAGGDGAGPRDDDGQDVPPVVWRTGPRSTEPHLLALGQPGSGTTTLLRSIALQALHHGDVLVVDGSGTTEYACLAGRPGVLGVECALTGALATLEWAVHETERRLISANQARQLGRPLPDDIRRPLWIVLDRPSQLSHLAAADRRTDPQELLRVPLRHGRAANIRVVVAEHLDGADALTEAVRSHTRARVVLGPASFEQIASVLGAPPRTTPTWDVPPGRGYARLGSGPVHRLQVPATPDPHDDSSSEAQRQAVLALLPERPVPGNPAVPSSLAGRPGADGQVEVAKTITAKAVDTDGPLPVQAT